MTSEETSVTVKKDLSPLYMPIAIVVAGALVSGALYMALAPRSGSVGTSGAAPVAKVNIKDVNIDGVPFIGKANAPLTMAYWADYQCSYCAQFETTVLPTLVEKYVDTGKLKIVFMDFAFLGPDSITAALYKHAVWELYSSKFFEWNEAMHKVPGQAQGGLGKEASILKLTANISGINASKLKALVASKKSTYEAAITAGQQEGAKFGINGTPGFVVGTKSISGAQPLEVFTAAIDSQLE